MAKAVNPRRAYESPLRREQAHATRMEIIWAAQRLFEDIGYARTTVVAVAREAGVAVKTVYLAFDTKAGILRAVWDVLLRGERDVPVAQTDWYRRVLEQGDPYEQLRMTAHNSRVVKERIGPILQVIRNAAPVDADVAVLWNLIQTDFHDNQRLIVRELHRKGSLKPHVDVERATDILWALNHPDIWHLLVGLRGWTAEEYEQWFAETACAQLLS